MSAETRSRLMSDRPTIEDIRRGVADLIAYAAAHRVSSGERDTEEWYIEKEHVERLMAALDGCVIVHRENLQGPAGRALQHARERAVATLIQGHHREEVSRLVFAYVDADEMPSAADVADSILAYLAGVIAPLLVSDDWHSEVVADD